MRNVMDPGRVRQNLIMIDDICYSHVEDLAGKPLELTMSLMTAFGGPGQPMPPKSPVILWVNGCGWRAPYALRNMMAPELVFLADCGYIVASVYYRTSDQGKFPAQMVDIKTAIRFLRASADKYHIDPDRIGIYGRSAGGHLASFAAMNTEDFLSDEWSGYSSSVQAACDLFGPVDMTVTIKESMKKIGTPGFRWNSLAETYDALLLGWDGSTEELLERAKVASPINYINDNMCDILIMHGDSDQTVPLSVSERFYEALVSSGREMHADLYVVTHGGHGSAEFYQDSTRKIITDFFDKRLKI